MSLATIADVKPRRYTMRDATGQVIGAGAELRDVPVAAIKVDSAYQREAKSAWVHQHMPFDPRRAGAVILSSRAGGPYCIDGGHRIALARESGVDKVHALVIDGLTQADEARLFVIYQRSRTNLTSHALFRAEVRAADPETLAMVRSVHNAGFTIGKSTSPVAITAIDAVRWVYRYGGDELLSDVLGLVKRIWFEEEKALSGLVLKGLALFLTSAETQESFQRERLEKVMRSCSPMKIISFSQAIALNRKSMSNTPANIAEALHQQYNKVSGRKDALGPLTLTNERRRPKPYPAKR